MSMPSQPKIYHITYLRNLTQLAKDGWLWSDARRIERDLDCEVVGMSHIKQRRLKEIEVTCHPGTTVGQYAPFYFCPRSIMLYILHRGNHPDLGYSEGQRPIVHLQADLSATIRWADSNGIRWAFSDRNAGGYLASFYNQWEQLDRVNWNAVAATDFRDALIKEGKQAEFLILDAFPWKLVEKLGVMNREMAGRVKSAIKKAEHKPKIRVERGWYY